MTAPGGRAIALTIPPAHKETLRQWFEAAAAGRREDAEREPDAPQNVARFAEAAVFDELLASLDSGTLRPTDAHRLLLADIAGAVDSENEWEKAKLEHNAIHGLLGQIEAAK